MKVVVSEAEKNCREKYKKLVELGFFPKPLPRHLIYSHGDKARLPFVRLTAEGNLPARETGTFVHIPERTALKTGRSR